VTAQDWNSNKECITLYHPPLRVPEDRKEREQRGYDIDTDNSLYKDRLLSRTLLVPIPPPVTERDIHTTVRFITRAGLLSTHNRAIMQVRKKQARLLDKEQRLRTRKKKKTARCTAQLTNIITEHNRAIAQVQKERTRLRGIEQRITIEKQKHAARCMIRLLTASPPPQRWLLEARTSLNPKRHPSTFSFSGATSSSTGGCI
jgi:C4-dicarboxylate-specific signal transduction histidine kinase